MAVSAASGPSDRGGSTRRDPCPLAALFELPAAIRLPGDHRRIELLAAAGHHEQAAIAIAALRAGSVIDGERAALAEAICWGHAGRPDLAVDVLAPRARTPESAWCLACALAWLGRLDEAADQVIHVGQRVPLLGPRRLAAATLLAGLRRQPPPWLENHGGEPQPRLPRREPPPPHLASFFVPARPEVPPGFEDVAEIIQRGDHGTAARRLIDRRVDTPRVGILVAVAVAECWLLADEPAAAQTWLQHRLPARGTWALACAHVQQHRLQEALAPLGVLARHGRLRHEWREATAALLAHLDLVPPPPDLAGLADHPLLERGRAEEEGYRRFADNVVREIVRQTKAEAVERIVRRVESRCAGIPSDQARGVLLSAYEAAVRVSPAPRPVAERGLSLLLSRPELLGDDEAEYSQALLLAMTCDRLDELNGLLERLGGPGRDDRTRFASLLAAAKLSLIRSDPPGVLRSTALARELVPHGPDYQRAARLRRAARWLMPDELPRVSGWRLRRIHHLLPLAVAERLDDRESDLSGWLGELAAASAAARRCIDLAAGHLAEAIRVGEEPTGPLPRLRQALGSWALLVGQALLEARRLPADEAVAFTAAAWMLLGPDPPEPVVRAHATAIGLACSGLKRPDEVVAVLDRAIDAIPSPPGRRARFWQDVAGEWERWRRTLPDARAQDPPDLGRRLRAAAPPPVQPSSEDVAPALGELDALTPEVREAIERCLVDRQDILPTVPPFRGRRWFQSDAAHFHYQRGREETDARAAHKAFEDAWMREPNAFVTTHGLILGLGGRLRQKLGRRHLLDRLARVLDQLAEREIEAALAHSTLASLASSERERRSSLERAVAALRRRVRRQPWVRARNAEIAIELELGNLFAAGDAAWEESGEHLPGSADSRRYALLAAALWRRTQDAEHPLDARIAAAERRAQLPQLTNRSAVQYAVDAGSLVLLSDLRLDEEALEDLWTACRGDEDDLCRFLEKWATRAVDPRPAYLRFMVEKLQTTNPPAAARLRNRFLEPDAAAEPPHLPWLRLAAAELLARDPLHEVATPRNRLREAHVRDLLACLRRSAPQDEVAYTAFCAAVEDALEALFDLREGTLVAGPEPYGERLAGASASVAALRWAARRFGTREVARIAGLVWRYLALALDPPAAESYLLEKEKRLVPSRLGRGLGEWWASLSASAGPLDFFHQHQAYRCPDGAGLDAWWRQRVHGRPMREALEQLLASLEAHARRLRAIEERYVASRARRGPGAIGFGLLPEFDACCRVLRSALADGASIEGARAVEGALEQLGTALRAIDMARLADVAPDVCADNALPSGRYLLPRALELLGHWRRNVRTGPWLQAACEVRDDAGRDVLCLLCLDRQERSVPESTPLRGMAPFADLVDAMGGQFHLWFARPGEQRGCRRDHDDSSPCTADDYVLRIEGRLRHLAGTRWHDRRPAIQEWLRVLDGALRSGESATLAFALLPRLHE